MSVPEEPQITRILSAIEDGQAREAAEAELWDLVHAELRMAAARALDRDRRGATLQPTALVGEVYLKLFGGEVAPKWENRRHFFGAAARAMRQLLIERARRHERQDEGLGERVTLEPGSDARTPDRVADPVLLAEALDALEAHDERSAQVVMLRVFGGLPHEDVARLLDVSLPTAKRDWAYGKSWLYRRLDGGEG